MDNIIINSETIFQIIQSFGIITSFVITIYTLYRSNKQQRSSNNLLITQHHREIWTTIYQNDKCKRVFNKNADIHSVPVTEEEYTFSNMIFLHMSACLKLEKAKACEKIEGMENDVKDILSYPIPRYVWMNVMCFHDDDFIRFVNNSIKTI